MRRNLSKFREHSKTMPKESSKAYREPSDVLDWSYVEMREHDFLARQDQEISNSLREQVEQGWMS
jgi:hypothetical protein